MAVPLSRSLIQLRNTRDLRAEMLALAADLVGNVLRGTLTVTEPAISRTTVQREWDRHLRAIPPDIGNRMTLVLDASTGGVAERHAEYRHRVRALPLDRPNYRFELLRLLVGASLDRGEPQSIKALLEAIGASQTPIRDAVAALRQAGVVESWNRGLGVMAEELSGDLLARVGALPQTLRFRFERGAQIKPPVALLKRALTLLGRSGPPGWEYLALSGTPVAQADVPTLDLLGVPRLDLVAQLPRAAKSFDAALLRLVDDGLEPEPSVLAPAPVVVTIVRADSAFVREAIIDDVRCAAPMDVFLSLLDIGLRDQAVHYAQAMRQ